MYNFFKFFLFFCVVFLLSDCSSDGKKGEKIYHSNFFVKEDYDIANYEIILDSEKIVKENLSNNITNIQKNTNHYINGENFTLKKLNGIANIQIKPERKFYVNLSPILFQDKIIINSDNNIIFCFNLEGKKLWSLNLNKEIFTKNNQIANYISIVDNDKMIIHSSNGEIAMFELKNINSKPIFKWKKDLQEKINSQITFDKHTKSFYILTIDSNIYEINLIGETIFDLKNTKQNGLFVENKSSSVYVDDKYIIYGDTDGEIFCLNKKNKKLNWNININFLKQDEGKEVFSGFIYDFVDDGDNIIVPSNLGLLISINKNNGTLKWVKEVSVNSEIIKNNDFIFFFDINNTLIAMKIYDGKVKWTKDFQIQKEYQIPKYLNSGNYKYFNINYQAPMIINSNIFAINYFGEMFKVSTNTGEIITKKHIPYYINGALVFSNGIGYACNFTGGIFSTVEDLTHDE